MKTTKILRTLCMLGFAALLSTNFGCAAFFDAELKGKEIPLTEDGMPDMIKIQEMAVQDFRIQNDVYTPSLDFFPKSTVEASAGIGFDSTEGETETTYCIGAGYNRRISKDNFNHASYIRGFVSQHWQSADERDFSLTRLGIGYDYYDRISKTGDVSLTYGLDLHYGFGNRDIFNVNEDVTRYGLDLTLGANFNVTPRTAIGVKTTVASWTQQTFESGGFEIDQQHTWVGLNKDNLIMAYGRFRLD